MNRKKNSPMIRILLLVAVLGAGTAVTALIQKSGDSKNQDAPPKEYNWDAPIGGTPVVYYVVELETNGLDVERLEDVTTETVMVPMKYGNKYRVRVAGVDAQGVQGPFSDWSRFLTPEIAPPDL